MKVANISPLFKVGDLHDITNYRPISKLTSFSKILEWAMHNRLTNVLDAKNTLYSKHFGFRKNHSTTHAIMEVVDKISEAIDNRKLTIGVFLDLSKAFDTIRHDVIWAKLEYYGVRDLALDWFRSYLADRFQQVSYNNAMPSFAPILYGVPQGSILGPLLYGIMISPIAPAIFFSMSSLMILLSLSD